jgi:hypothetical protein
MNKRNPIRGALGLYRSCLFDGFYRPYVKIFGSDGSVLKIIECCSNDDAKKVCNDLNAQLTDWVARMKGE